MRQQPTGEDLLACAREVLRAEVLPALPAEHRHALLMAMNAMSIAERQLRNGDAPDVEELVELRTLLDDHNLDLGDGNRRLAKLLRAGAGDPDRGRHRAMLAHLRAATIRRLTESNPKALPKNPL